MESIETIPGLSAEVSKSIRLVFAVYNEISEVLLYGSRAKGNFRPDSDIDLTLKGDELNLQILNKIELDLDELLLPHSFDLSICSQIKNEALIDHIARVGKLFYKCSELKDAY